MWFQKVFILPFGMLLEIPRGLGVLKVKLLEEKYEAKLEFPEGEVVRDKNLDLWGSMGIFWNFTLWKKHNL